MPESEVRPTVQPPPFPWIHVNTWSVGGLFQVGYREGSDLLLVLSSQGRGVFDCLTGEKIARDDEEAHDSFDPIRLIAQGFGPLEGEKVRMAGLFGGGLPHTTEDGWFLEEEAPAWPVRSVLLMPPSATSDDGRVTQSEAVVIADDGACELRAYGFSETGKSLIVASSCDLAIFGRP